MQPVSFMPYYFRRPMMLLILVGILSTQTASSSLQKIMQRNNVKNNPNYLNNTATKSTTYYCGIATRLFDTNRKAAQHFCDYSTTNLDFWWNWDIQPHFDFDNDDDYDNNISKNVTNTTTNTTTTTTTNTTLLLKDDYNTTKDCLKEKFIPMIYGVNTLENSEKATNIGSKNSQYNLNAIMGYNEPDLYAPGAASGTWTPNFQCGRDTIAKDWQAWVISYLEKNPNGIIISPAMTSYTGGIWPTNDDTFTTTTTDSTSDGDESDEYIDDGEEYNDDDDDDDVAAVYFNFTTSNTTTSSPSRSPSSSSPSSSTYPDSICNNAKQQPNDFQRDCLGWLQCFKNNVIKLNCGKTDCWNIISIIQFHSYMYTSKEFITKVQIYENAWSSDLLGMDGMSTKKLWVTEFAKAGITNPNRIDKSTIQFIQKTIKYMKESPFVSGWSWFSEHGFKSFYIDGLQPTTEYWSSNLFNENNGKPTELGKVYFDACSNKGDDDGYNDDDDNNGIIDSISSPGDDDNNATKSTRSGKGDMGVSNAETPQPTPSSLSPTPVDTTTQPDMTDVGDEESSSESPPTSLRSSIDIATTTQQQQQQQTNAPSIVVEDEVEEENDFNQSSSSSSRLTKHNVISLVVLVLFIFFLVRLLIHLPVWQQACGSSTFQPKKTKRSLYQTVPSSFEEEEDESGSSSKGSSKTNNSRNNNRNRHSPHPKQKKKRDPNLYQTNFTDFVGV